MCDRDIKVLLCYKEHKKVVVVSTNDALSRIYDAARELHSDPLLQHYDADFEESYEMRRNDIVSNMKPVSQILVEYPFLGDRYELLAEMSRIMHNPSLFDENKWREVWVPKLLALCSTNLVADAQKKAVQLLESAGNDSTGDKITVNLLPLLPLLVPDHKVKPEPEKLIVLIPDSLQASVAASEVAHNTPTLIVKERGCEVFLVVERQVICKIPGELSTAYLLSAYYVFDIVYPKGLSSLYILLEKLLLGKHHNKTPQIVSRVFSALSTN